MTEDVNSKLPALMAELRAMEGNPARALELAILTGARPGEIRLAGPAEFDLSAMKWTVPAAHTKEHRERCVPLSAEAVDIVRQAMKAQAGDFLFAGGQPSKPLSDAAMSAVLKRAGLGDLNIYDFYREVHQA